MLTPLIPIAKSTESALAHAEAPLVSILVNNYNYGQFLADCLNSCMSQSYPVIEIVVVDDGSTDNSVEIIHQYSEKIPYLKPVLKANGGQASALNSGFAVSQGEIIVLLDADDYLFPDAIERIVVAWTAAFPCASMLQGRLKLVDQGGEFIDVYPAPEKALHQGDVVPILLQKGRYSTTVTSGLSFSRAALDKILPIPEADFRLCADGYLVTVAPFFGPISNLEQPIGGRRKHCQNLWAVEKTEGAAKQRRRSLEHDFLRYHYLDKMAVSHGYSQLKPSVQIGLGDPLHLWDRLISLRLNSIQHPIVGDRRLQLALHGIRAFLTDHSFSLKRRFILLFWFLWVAAAPLPWAKTAIYWRLSSDARPPTIDKLIKFFRKLSQ